MGAPGPIGRLYQWFLVDEHWEFDLEIGSRRFETRVLQHVEPFPGHGFWLPFKRNPKLPYFGVVKDSMVILGYASGRLTFILRLIGFPSRAFFGRLEEDGLQSKLVGRHRMFGVERYWIMFFVTVLILVGFLSPFYFLAAGLIEGQMVHCDPDDNTKCGHLLSNFGIIPVAIFMASLIHLWIRFLRFLYRRQQAKLKHFIESLVA